MIYDDSGTGRAPGEKRWSVVKAALLGSMLAAGSAAAQDAGEIFLDATYLAAPNEWCAANAGVPMIVTMDGPDIIKGPKEFPRTVTERRGSNVRVITGEFISSFNHPEDFIGLNAEVIGRFSAEFRTCSSLWEGPRLTGTWHLSGSDNSVIDSGTFENEPFFLYQMPFFRSVSGSSDALYAKFGDRLLFAAGRPAITTTQTFLAEPDKE